MKAETALFDTPENISWEDLLELREKVMMQKEELEATVKVLSEEFLHRLAEEKLSGKVVGNYSISKAVRYGFETTLEQATELGATKTVVDPTALKKLMQKGIIIPGVKKTEYCMVRTVEKNTE